MGDSGHQMGDSGHPRQESGVGYRDLTAWLEAVVAETGSKPVLLLGDVAPHIRGDNVTRVIHPASDDVLTGGERHFDLAVVVGVLQGLPHETAGALLARLRDLSARRLLVTVPTSAREGAHRSVWTRDDMLAHGLHALGKAQHAAETLAVYGFDIDQYKRTPDWLNPSGWANPENWGKYRW